MGISGLLPLLKSIQVQKHLSEFAGQTLAVDGYVWLHRGTYACATELATGKNTSKYVEYAMQKVRLLRHHGIHPYLVFDGGPLPAKRGTEKERQQRRADNLARGHALAAQGRHKEAREFYCKCVDVTPQMAYQLIKALKAAGVPYLVAPYEADAQLAYLERLGLVDGIITEDSDLLVFGCQRVLTKLDPVAATLVSISRADFGAVNAAAGGLSLRGWSDAEFRAMAILSGCDYLPSISGVGLKTAYGLLRKHKTAENVVRALRLEGKKDVPKGYMEAFRLAEKVFLHQRVYDPFGEKLVHLTEIPAGTSWSAEYEAYIGEHIEPSLAKKIAEGDACPIALGPMEDINPSYTPRTVKPLVLVENDLNRSAKAKGKMSVKCKSESIMSFFTPKTKPAVEPKAASQPQRRIIAGQASGKRTLSEVTEHDITHKRKRRDASPPPSDAENISPPARAQSRFFGASTSATSTKAAKEKQKEIIVIDDDDEVDEPDPVTQEDGYLSPGTSLARLDTPELSSPAHGRADAFGGADVLSSPEVGRTAPTPARMRPIPIDFGAPPARVLVGDTPTKAKIEAGEDLGLDLFADESVSGDEAAPQCSFGSTATSQSRSGPEEPDDALDVDLDFEFVDEGGAAVGADAAKAVAQGWWAKWAAAGPSRTATPDTRKGRVRPQSAPGGKKTVSSASTSVRKAAGKRKSLVFAETVRTTTPAPRRRAAPASASASASRQPRLEQFADGATARMERFRCAAP